MTKNNTKLLELAHKNLTFGKIMSIELFLKIDVDELAGLINCPFPYVLVMKSTIILSDHTYFNDYNNNKIYSFLTTDFNNKESWVTPQKEFLQNKDEIREKYKSENLTPFFHDLRIRSKIYKNNGIYNRHAKAIEGYENTIYFTYFKNEETNTSRT